MQRLRMLNLLKEGPLCVCHLQEILEESQVKTSKQLLYMKKLGLVEAKREGFWMVYSLRKPACALISANLSCLRDSPDDYPALQEDLKRRADILRRFAENQEECPKVVYDSMENTCG